MHALGAAGLGLLFLIGRMVYFKAYIADPASRGVGMMIGFLSIMILMLGALVGIIIEIV
jgi:glutathione S-transferase